VPIPDAQENRAPDTRHKKAEHTGRSSGIVFGKVPERHTVRGFNERPKQQEVYNHEKLQQQQGPRDCLHERKQKRESISVLALDLLQELFLGV
jgi:hypothetical protein